MSGYNKKNKDRLMIGGAIGNCVHVAGIFSYLQLAEKAGYKTVFLGPALPPEKWVNAILEYNPEVVCISYRLTSSVLVNLLDELFEKLEQKNILAGRKYYFGGTPECIRAARRYPYFSHFFQGEENFNFLMSTLITGDEKIRREKTVNCLSIEGGILSPSDLKNAIREGRYFPMIRHHFGLPSLEETIEGIEKIAESHQVDVISLAPDQNAQEYFFEPEKMNPALDGAGGIPIRTEDDLLKLWQAAQRGNYPKLRIYAGTNNLIKWAELGLRTINNAWGAIPLFWYSVLDGRSARSLEDAIRENMDAIRWYAERGIPVEINNTHHWSLRESPDTIAVADFYIAAYNAKKLGVKTFIAQLMFNTPRLTTAKMDLAKMLAKLELISELEDDSFICLRQVRAGLTHFSIDTHVAKGQLAASTLLSLSVMPQIIHVVGYTEADHAATAEEVIESCKIVRGVLRNAWEGFPDLTIDPDVQERKKHLVREAKYLLEAVKEQFSRLSADPLGDPVCLAQMVRTGILDAPHLLNNPAALGKIKTLPVNGGYEAVDERGRVISEARRLKMLDLPRKFKVIGQR